MLRVAMSHPSPTFGVPRRTLRHSLAIVNTRELPNQQSVGLGHNEIDDRRFRFARHAPSQHKSLQLVRSSLLRTEGRSIPDPAAAARLCKFDGEFIVRIGDVNR